MRKAGGTSKMNLLENVYLAVFSIKANKMRSILTMLGIIIGIASVIIISAIGNGGKYQIQKSLEQFGTNRLIFYMNWQKQSEITFRDYINDRDIEAIQQIPGIEAITPLFEEWTAIRVRDSRMDVILIGANEDSQIINNVEMVQGRFISNRDVESFTSHIVISEKDALSLFGKVNVVGEAITVNTFKGPVDFNIIGVTRYEENIFSGSMNQGRSQIFIPISTIMRIYNQDVYYGFNLKIMDRIHMENISGQVIRLLERLHNNKDKYNVFNLEQMLESVNRVINTVTRILTLIAGIALLVGGIGVMNIMLVAVTERIREIGIKKAVGAGRRDILLQFITESAVISLIGGGIGILLGIALGTSLSFLLKLPPFIGFYDILFALVLSVSIGLFFGVYPASRAAKLDPIEALGYE
jgi:putative ABC transport system permease protein